MREDRKGLPVGCLRIRHRERQGVAAGHGRPGGRRPQEFSVVKHVILPFLGLVAIAVPVYYLTKPGQSQPYSWFPYAALAIVVVAVIYSIFLSRRDPGLGDRVGSIVADE